MVAAVKAPRKYVSLNESTWAEVRALWEVGDSTLEDLSARFGVSLRTIQAHLKKHGSAKGSKAAAMAVAIKEKVFEEELDDPERTKRRGKELRERGYTDSVRLAELVMAQLDAAQGDPTQISRATNAMKMLSLAAAALERANDMSWRCLGLDRDAILEPEELVVRVLTEEDVAAIRESQRLATDGEDVEAMLVLSGAGDDRENEVIHEGANDNEVAPVQEGRTELKNLLAYVRKGDVVMVTKIDRLARSVGDLQEIVKAIRTKGAGLQAVDQPIDTSTAAGKAFLDMLGVFAEFETNPRRERQLEGIAKAKSAGVYKGRKSSIDPADVRRLRDQGVGASEIAKQLNIGRASVYRVLGTEK